MKNKAIAVVAFILLLILAAAIPPLVSWLAITAGSQVDRSYLFVAAAQLFLGIGWGMSFFPSFRLPLRLFLGAFIGLMSVAFLLIDALLAPQLHLLQLSLDYSLFPPVITFNLYAVLLQSVVTFLCVKVATSMMLAPATPAVAPVPAEEMSFAFEPEPAEFSDFGEPGGEGERDVELEPRDDTPEEEPAAFEFAPGGRAAPPPMAPPPPRVADLAQPTGDEQMTPQEQAFQMDAPPGANYGAFDFDFAAQPAPSGPAPDMSEAGYAPQGFEFDAPVADDSAINAQAAVLPAATFDFDMGGDEPAAAPAFAGADDLASQGRHEIAPQSFDFSPPVESDLDAEAAAFDLGGGSWDAPAPAAPAAGEPAELEGFDMGAWGEAGATNEAAVVTEDGAFDLSSEFEMEPLPAALAPAAAAPPPPADDFGGFEFAMPEAEAAPAAEPSFDLGHEPATPGPDQFQMPEFGTPAPAQPAEEETFAGYDLSATTDEAPAEDLTDFGHLGDEAPADFGLEYGQVETTPAAPEAPFDLETYAEPTAEFDLGAPAEYAPEAYAEPGTEYVPEAYPAGEYAPEAYAEAAPAEYAPEAYGEPTPEYAQPYGEAFPGTEEYAPEAYAEAPAEYAPEAYGEAPAEYAPEAYAAAPTEFAPEAYAVEELDAGTAAIPEYGQETYAEPGVEYVPVEYAEAPSEYAAEPVEYAEPGLAFEEADLTDVPAELPQDVYAELPGEYAPEAYAEAPAEYAPEAYAEPTAEYAPEAYAEAPAEYAPEAYAEAPAEYAPEAYAEAPAELLPEPVAGAGDSTEEGRWLGGSVEDDASQKQRLSNIRASFQELEAVNRELDQLLTGLDRAFPAGQEHQQMVPQSLDELLHVTLASLPPIESVLMPMMAAAQAATAVSYVEPGETGYGGGNGPVSDWQEPAAGGGNWDAPAEDAAPEPEVVAEEVTPVAEEEALDYQPEPLAEETPAYEPQPDAELPPAYEEEAYAEPLPDLSQEVYTELPADLGAEPYPPTGEEGEFPTNGDAALDEYPAGDYELSPVTAPETAEFETLPEFPEAQETPPAEEPLDSGGY